MTSDEKAGLVLGILTIGPVFVFLFVVWWNGAFTPWRERRVLIRLARSYGIEHVPGEDLEALRGKVLQRRDEVCR